MQIWINLKIKAIIKIKKKLLILKAFKTSLFALLIEKKIL